VLSHELSIPLDAELADLVDTSPAIRSENETKELSQKVVELFAVVWISELGAITTSREGVLNAARSDFAPLRLFVLVTTGASALSIRPACTTVQTAVGNEAGV
jgi:hypothetical protein